MSRGRWAVSLALLAATFVYLQFFTATEVMPIRQSLDRLPMEVGNWRGAESAVLDDEVMALLKPTDYVVRRYVGPDGRSLWLYVGYWGTQRKGAQIHSPKNCLPGGGWEALEAKQQRISLGPAERSIEVNHYVLQKGSERQIVFYWFDAQGRAVASEIQAKIELLRGAMLRNRSDGAIVRVSGMVDGDTAETTDSLVRFVQAIYPMLSEFLPN